MSFKRTLKLIALVILFLILFVQEAKEPNSVNAQGPLIRIALDYEPVTLDPVDPSFRQSEEFVANQIFESLFKYSPEGTIEPAGATHYEVSEDGHNYTVYLRDAKWSDGVDVTNQHYVDGITRLFGSRWDYLLDSISTIYTGPNNTIEITLTTPDVHFPHLLATPFISYPIRPGGPNVYNGPYKVIGSFPGNPITLVKNENYWGAADVQIDVIDFYTIPDFADQLEAYQNNLIDVSGSPGDHLPTIQGDPLLSAELRRISTPGIYFLGLNFAQDHTNNVDLRIALASSIDRETLLNDLNMPWRLPATGVIPPGVPGHRATGVGYDFDLTRAGDHMTAYIAANPSIDYASEIDLELWSNIQSSNIPQAVADMWEMNLGVNNVTHITWSWSNYLTKLSFCDINPGDETCGYNAYRLGWLADYLDPWNILNDLFHPDAPSNHTHWDDSVYRDLLDLAEVEGDEASRIGYYQAAEQILVEEDVAVIPLFYYDRVILIKSDVNYEYPADGRAPHIMNWSISTNNPFTVTSLEDPGTPADFELTLREAIEAANANPGPDTIHFDIPGEGPHTIQPITELPVITDPVTIDGYTQPGASPNTNPLNLGSNAVLKIELDGKYAGTGTNGLHITGGNTTIRGFVINRFLSSTGGIHGNGIRIAGSEGNIIEGNYIGTDVSGSIDLGNGGDGVYIYQVSTNTIGGSTPEARNVISGNNHNGIVIFATTLAPATDNLIQGNFIGTDASGNFPIGNLENGVNIYDAANNSIGGTTAGSGNVISGNGLNGVRIVIPSATGNEVLGNYIGTNATGDAAIGNSRAGVEIQNAPGNIIGGSIPGSSNLISGNQTGVFISNTTIAANNLVQGNLIGTDTSGTSPIGNNGPGVDILNASDNLIEANTIAFNMEDGIHVYGGTATGNRITKNSIHNNIGKGIETIQGGNDEHDPPMITDMLGDSIQGTVPLNSVVVEIFDDGDGEGRTFLGTAEPAGGTFSFSGILSGPNLTATSTDQDGNTSEFSIPVQWAPDNCEFNNSFDESCDIETTLGFSINSDGSFISYISHKEDVDWFYLDLPDTIPPGSQISVLLSGEDGGELPANFDLVVLGEMGDDPGSPASPLEGVQVVPLEGVPLEGVPLEGVDADSVPLEGVPLEGVEVREIILQETPLEGVPLEGVPLEGVPLEGVPLEGVGFHQGTTPEEVTTLFRGGMTGRYYVMVWSSTGEYSTSLSNSPYEVIVSIDEVTADVCNTALHGVSIGTSSDSIIHNPGNPTTLILINRPRMEALYPPTDPVNELVVSLQALAVEINALVVDLGAFSYSNLKSAYDAWDTLDMGCDPKVANEVTIEIKLAILELLADPAYDTIQNIVLIGNDLMIPHRRVPDEVVRTPDGATVPNEYDYQYLNEDTIERFIGVVGTRNSPTFATLRLQYYMSDDFYADQEPVMLDHGHELSIPDMPIGRLVETPNEIKAYIDSFMVHEGIMGDDDGELTVTSLTSGYSFLIDQALEILRIMTDPTEGKNFIPVNDPDIYNLINDTWDNILLLDTYQPETNPDADPKLRAPWLSSINAHFDHFRAAPANFLNSGDPAALFGTNHVFSDPTDMTGTLLFTVGCHSGLNFFDDDLHPGSLNGEQDWPQTLVSLGASLIGNWGYGYGDDAVIAYSEELMVNFARNLGSGNLGQALVDAKREYLLNQAILDPVHEKILMESIFYGLPNWQLSATVPSPTTGVTVTDLPGSSVPVLTSTNYHVVVDSGQPERFTVTNRGYYYALEGQTQAALYRPVQPQTSFDVSNGTGEVAHGAMFIGGTYFEVDPDGNGETNDFDPVITMPSWTRTNPEPQFLYEGWDPAKFWSLAQLDRGDGTYDERLVIVPGQFLVDEAETLATGNTIGTERIYDSLDFEVFYAPLTAEFQPPIIHHVSARVSSNPGVHISVAATDPSSSDPQFGIVKVFVTYTEKTGGSTWQNVTLDFNPVTDRWENVLPINESIEFHVQVVDNFGNVGMFAGNGYFSPIVVSISGPSTAIAGQLVSFTATSPELLSEPFYTWDFGDGHLTEGPATVFHSYSDPGDYQVTVHVSDLTGNLGEATFEITIDPIIIDPFYDTHMGMIALISAIDAMPPEAIKEPAGDRRQTLFDKLHEINLQIQEENFKAVVNKLTNDIRKKTDGCGTAPDGNDWILDCATQLELQAIIDSLIATLEALM
ncbi:MAG: PKD domain-containing protein [Anaerolineales bacterium]|nr:PKD domain-containing protein [Anaerolineales bacterium]